MTDRRADEIAALAELMRALPLAPGSEARIDGEAESLWIHARLATVHDAPRLQPLGAAGVAGELQDTMRLACDLHDLLGSLHKTTLDALAAGGGRPAEEVRPPLKVRADLAAIIRAADAALKAIVADPPPPVRGAPRKRHAASVTGAAAECYEHLTGRRAGRSVVGDKSREGGQFLKFLTGVFDVFGIEARPAAQIKTMELSARK